MPTIVPTNERWSRRTFLATAASALGTFAVAGCGDSQNAKTTEASSETNAAPRKREVRVPFDTVETSLDESGNAIVPATTEAPSILLIQPKDAPLIAYANMCTHSACPIIPDLEKEQIVCDPNCGHGSIYSLDGNVLVGPSMSPLFKFPVERADTELVITIQYGA
ncbi:MAG: Rieske 2Fe-2S domain-containing protein [Candidatus Poribacteria bacterium]|nr:Rieske 2Fe-2S domain-containing protein [Candidatus Poribacteria bacterium]